MMHLPWLSAVFNPVDWGGCISMASFLVISRKLVRSRASKCAQTVFLNGFAAIGRLGHPTAADTSGTNSLRRSETIVDGEADSLYLRARTLLSKLRVGEWAYAEPKTRKSAKMKRLGRWCASLAGQLRRNSDIAGVSEQGTRSLCTSGAEAPDQSPHLVDIIPGGGGYLRTGHPPDRVEDQRFLVTGASGQIGSELLPFLRRTYPPGAVIASDVKVNRELLNHGNFVYCDVQDQDSLARIVLENGITHIIHLATLLSAVGERSPQLALRVNTRGVQNVLELAAQNKLKVFAPSTIAVFGPSSPKLATPDDAVKDPTTMYGITKVHQELLGSYYHEKFGVDYRSLRFPGIISSNTLPGGGTTDYATEMFYAALSTRQYKCFLEPDTRLPFLYMPDCLGAIVQLLNADSAALTQRSYNVTATSFTPRELTSSIQRVIPNFSVEYHPDFRQSIAASWPISIDDSRARQDWNWEHAFGVDDIVEHMLVALESRKERTPLSA